MQVVAVGSGKADDKGKTVKPSLSVGDTVLYSKYAGVEFEVSSSLPAPRWFYRKAVLK